MPGPLKCKEEKTKHSEATQGDFYHLKKRTEWKGWTGFYTDDIHNQQLLGIQ